MRTHHRRDEAAQHRVEQLYGLIAVGLLVALLAVLLGVYNQAFTERVNVTLNSDRAGLLLEPGADVALRNVTVGKVESVDATDEGASIKLSIKPEDASRIASNAGANIVSPTLLGPKYVNLEIPPRSGSRALRDGDEIPTRSVQVEANAAFEDLVAVLDGIQPAQLNSALGAVSQTLDHRGRQLGDYLEQANAYFAKFNSALPRMERDLALTADVTRAYAKIAPDLLAVLDAATTTGSTIVTQERALDSLLEALVTTSDSTRGFLARNRVPLRQSMSLLRPGTETLARYAPMFPCLFQSLNDYRKSVEPASGGTYPGLWVHLSVLPAADGYDSSKYLPVVGADVPTCSGGPMGPKGHFSHPQYNDGSPPLDNRNSPVTLQDGSSLALLLFGNYLELPGLSRKAN